MRKEMTFKAADGRCFTVEADCVTYEKRLETELREELKNLSAHYSRMKSFTMPKVEKQVRECRAELRRQLGTKRKRGVGAGGCYISIGTAYVALGEALNERDRKEIDVISTRARCIQAKKQLDEITKRRERADARRDKEKEAKLCRSKKRRRHTAPSA